MKTLKATNCKEPYCLLHIDKPRKFGAKNFNIMDQKSMMSYGKRIITKYFSSPLDLTQSNFYELIDFDKKNYKRVK